jgi:hypothetical protein
VSEAEEPPPPPSFDELVDSVAAWMVETVKRTLIDGPNAAWQSEKWFDDNRAVTEELFDEKALFEMAREQADEALKPVLRAVLHRAREETDP